MNVNRSGYYKWKKRQGTLNRYEQDRQVLTELLKETHAKHKSYGYHRLAAIIRQETGWIFSDNLAHKCCKEAGIKSKAKHYKYHHPGDEHLLFPNEIRGKWTASRPLEIVVSDMTCLKCNGKHYEWTYILDTYNNEIISSHVSNVRGDRRTYFKCLKDLTEKMKEQNYPVVLHTDQGSIYSSRAFCDAHKDYNIKRSMSRAGTPTDNPIIESLNGWIKAELITDYEYWKCKDIYALIDEYVYYFNNYRPAFALNYKSPVQYRTEQGF